MKNRKCVASVIIFLMVTIGLSMSIVIAAPEITNLAIRSDAVPSYWLNTVGIKPQVKMPGNSFEAVVDNINKLKGHGSSDMPIWGHINNGDSITVRKAAGGYWQVIHSRMKRSVKIKANPPRTK